MGIILFYYSIKMFFYYHPKTKRVVCFSKLPQKAGSLIEFKAKPSSEIENALKKNHEVYVQNDELVSLVPKRIIAVEQKKQLLQLKNKLGKGQASSKEIQTAIAQLLS